MPQASLAATIDGDLMPKQLLAYLQQGWTVDQVSNLMTRFAQDEGHASGGAVYSQNLEDRRHEPINTDARKRWYWNLEYADPFNGPARGMERALGRDLIKSPRQYRLEQYEREDAQ